VVGLLSRTCSAAYCLYEDITTRQVALRFWRKMSPDTIKKSSLGSPAESNLEACKFWGCIIHFIVAWMSTSKLHLATFFGKNRPLVNHFQDLTPRKFPFGSRLKNNDYFRLSNRYPLMGPEQGDFKSKHKKNRREKISTRLFRQIL